mmetsp:Transcript_45726/g.147209  ORF Transcript_45726/g.147209 Transcript_45726/m.147209 type:complete len:286 (-) Transcript_45726:233-1090(-)
MPQRRADREQPLHGERVRLVVRGACALSAPRGRRAFLAAREECRVHPRPAARCEVCGEEKPLGAGGEGEASAVGAVHGARSLCLARERRLARVHALARLLQAHLARPQQRSLVAGVDEPVVHGSHPLAKGATAQVPQLVQVAADLVRVGDEQRQEVAPRRLAPLWRIHRQDGLKLRLGVASKPHCGERRKGGELVGLGPESLGHEDDRDGGGAAEGVQREEECEHLLALAEPRRVVKHEHQPSVLAHSLLQASDKGRGRIAGRPAGVAIRGARHVPVKLRERRFE